MSSHDGLWPHPHYTGDESLQLEEQCGYLLQPPRQTAQSRTRPYDASLPQPARFPSFAQNQFGNSSASSFSQQELPSFSQLAPDLNRSQWDPSSSAFGSSPIPPQSSPAFTQSSSSSDQPAYQTPFAAGFNLGPSTPLTNDSPSYMPPGPLQFSLPQPPPRRQSEVQAQYFNAIGSSHGAKRLRVDDDDDQDPESPQEPDSTTKQKPNSACSRCRGLKVRCEFLGDSDLTCKRCMQAGQECVIPDRKPRRRPPKRELLLKQIREQANQIEELIAKLEQSNRRATTSTGLTPLEPFSTSSGIDTNEGSVVPKPEVQDWIAKAKESLQAFGELIPAAAASSSNDDVRDADRGASDDEGADDSDGDTGYDTADENLPSGSSPAPPTKKKDPKLIPEEAPYGLMARMSIKSRQKSAEPESSDAIGVANVDFFRPSPAPNPIRISQPTYDLPYILTRGVVSVHEVEALFDIYFKNMNPSTSLLDVKLHSPQYVAMRSPFLFTVVCAIASRFYPERPDLYSQLIHYARLRAGTALVSGTKNEEMCAAYLLMQLYPVPAKRWEEDRGWIYLGVGIRIAQDINLNKPIATKPLNEHHARRLLSRTRIWLNCYNLDRSTGAQYGKPPIIPNKDYVAGHSDNWWNSSPYNQKGFDIQLCIYKMELKLMGEFLGKVYSDPNHPMGLNKSINFPQIASETDDQLRSLAQQWFPRLDEFDRESQVSVFRSELLKMSCAYQRLVALSAGLKYAKADELDESAVSERCLEAACDVVNAFVRRLFVTSQQKVYLRHAPEGQFVFVTFAGAFLVKLLQPKYAHRFSTERRKEIRTLVQEAVDLLGSPDVAIDEKHAPSLYSRFLAGLLASMTADPPAGQSNGVPVGTNTSKRPSSKARGKTREDPTPTAFHAQGAGGGQSPTSASNPKSNLVPGYSLGSRLSPTSPGSTRHSESPSPLHSPPQGLLNVPQQQQHPYQNVPSPAVSTLPLAEGNGAMGSEAGSIAASELFHTPMPIDQDLLQSMQFMNNPVWQDTTVPGFNWMNQFDMAGSNDYMFGSQPFVSPQF